MDAGEILGILGHDFQQVVRSARHQVAFEDIGDPRHRAFKGVKQIIGLTLQGDLHENRGRATKASGVQKRDIAGDEAVLFQPLHPPVTGRWRQVYLLGQFRIGDAAVLLQNGQNASVGCVDF